MFLFFRNKSHKADEYIRVVKDRLDQAVSTCIDCSGFVYEAQHQQDMLYAAQFGKSYLINGTCMVADKFADMCVNLRVLNSIRSYHLGMPMTLKQMERLTKRVVVDRLLNRRLWPYAIEACKLFGIPKDEGENRALAHWACYKVSTSNEDATAVARKIIEKLGNHPQISYCDVASKAAECGKKELAIKLLENEVGVNKQVPLLVKLGQESTALHKALASGNRDLAFTVILHLRAVLASSDFHILIRKYPLATVLYQAYCRESDLDALEDWYVQEDDFVAQAKRNLSQAYESTRSEVRANKFFNMSKQWERTKADGFKALSEDAHKLVQEQNKLENDTAESLMGLTTNETIYKLLLAQKAKQAEKLKSDMKVSDKTFAWLKVRALARLRQWDELKKWVKQKRLPISMTQVSIV